MFNIIELIFSSIGIYGFFTENIYCVSIGLVAIIICDFIDTFILGHNPTTIFLACLLAIGASIATKNPLYTFTIALCGENFIMSIVTIFMLIVSFIAYVLKRNTNDKA